MSRLKKVCYSLAAFCLLFALWPLVYGIYHIGNTLLLLVALYFVALPWLKDRGSRLYPVAKGLGMVGALVFIAISTFMITKGWFSPPPNGGRQTLIVLGNRVVHDRPGAVVQRRLDVASQYLQANPHAVCIVSGGQGPDEDAPEALVMAAYLEEQGISSTRILTEARSRNTRENLRFSQPLIPSDSEGVVIVTDNFHQGRASVTATTLGLAPLYHLSSRPLVGLLPSQWLRELPGIPLTWWEERVLGATEPLVTRNHFGG